MTYVESLKDIRSSTATRGRLPQIFSSHFRDTQKAIDKQCSFYVQKLFASQLSKAEKIELMDYIERLQFASDLLRTKDIPPEDLRRAARHLGKKMQSAFSD